MIASGEAVRVLEMEKEGHVRTPDYVKGKTGQVASILGTFKDPESLADGGNGLPAKTLYKVVFRQADLWDGYAGSPDDVLYVDVYEHWLEPAREAG